MTMRPASSRWSILAAALIGTFVATLGNSVANLAVPSIMDEFGVSLSSAVWVVTLYVVTFAVLTPACGYLGDLYGQRRLYLLGMGLFTLASVASGLAPTFDCLLGARVLLGIGVAPTLPALMAIIARTFPPSERGRAMGLWALANGAAHALGPPLSGFLLPRAGWRAVFLAGVPLCLVNLAMVWRRLPPDRERTGRSFDLGGMVALTATALGLMLALTQSAHWGWASQRSLWLWGATLVALVAFILRGRQAVAPFVELSLFADRRYAAAVAVIAIQCFCLFGLLLALPIFLTQAQGWSAEVTGLLILPLPLTMALAGPLAGRLADDRGSRRVCSLGMGLAGLAGLALLTTRVSPAQAAPWWIVVACLAPLGVGMGLTQSPVTAAVTQVVRQDQVGVATGLFHMGRFVSGTLGSTVLALILQLQPAGVATGFRRGLLLLVVLAGLAVLAAQWLPGRPQEALARRRGGGE